MKQFEYIITRAVFPGPVSWEEWLKDLGSKGWQLVSISMTNNTDLTETHWNAIFMRKVHK